MPGVVTLLWIAARGACQCHISVTKEDMGYFFTVSEEEKEGGIPKLGFENDQALLISLLSTMTLAPFESR